MDGAKVFGKHTLSHKTTHQAGPPPHPRRLASPSSRVYRRNRSEREKKYRISCSFRLTKQRGEKTLTTMIDIHYSLRGGQFLRGEARETVQFKYNIATDRAFYLISCGTSREFHFYMASLDNTPHALPSNHPPLHPFSIHLILLFKLVFSRGGHLEGLTRTLVAEEEGRGAEEQQGGRGDIDGAILESTNNDINNNNNISERSALDAAETERHLRRLHGLFKDFIVGENINTREMATVGCLLRDLRRLREYASKWRRSGRKLSSSNKKEEIMTMATANQTQSCPSPPLVPPPPIQQQQQQQQLKMFDWLDDSSDSESESDTHDPDFDKDDNSGHSTSALPFPQPQHPHHHHHHIHKRLRDSFLYLHDFCANRALRLNTRKERTTNLINLRYNLLANQNFLSSHRIAEESASIAHEARRDTVAMRTIAVLGMLFVPPAFVSGLLGTNLLMLDTGGGGGGGTGRSGARIVVSDFWWMYFVLAVPLTGATFGIWLLIMRRSKKRRRFGGRS